MRFKCQDGEKNPNFDFEKKIGHLKAGGVIKRGNVTGAPQQTIPGKAPEGDLAICHIHIPGTCIINPQNPS